MTIKKFVTLCILTAALSGCIGKQNKPLVDESTKKTSNATVLSPISHQKKEVKTKPSYHILRLGVTDYSHLEIEGCERFGITYTGMANPNTLTVIAGMGGGGLSYHSIMSNKLHFYGADLDILKVNSDSLVLGYKGP